MPGSVDTDQVLRLAGQSRKLMREIFSALHDAGRTLSSLSWSGARLGRQWAHLGGERVLPYGCVIGSKTLVIDGTLRFFDNSGRYLSLDSPTVHQDAKFIAESNPSWTWKTKTPNARKKKPT
jgi:hypothetical protein